MDPHDLSAILRHDRSCSLSKLRDIGKALNLKLTMEWT